MELPGPRIAIRAGRLGDARAATDRIAGMDASAVPILQSSAWAAVQRALGRTVHERSGDGWRYLAIVEKGRLGSRLYAPLGPAVESVSAFGEAMTDMRALAADARVDFVRVEPTAPIVAADLESLGAIRAFRTVQPDCTVINDVTSSEDDIAAAFGSTARRNWRWSRILRAMSSA